MSVCLHVQHIMIFNTICRISWLINISATQTTRHDTATCRPYVEDHTSVIFSDNAIHDINVIIYFSRIFFFHFKAIDTLKGRIHMTRYNIYMIYNIFFFGSFYLYIWNRFFSLVLLQIIIFYIQDKILQHMCSSRLHIAMLIHNYNYLTVEIDLFSYNFEHSSGLIRSLTTSSGNIHTST
jgi:hypothetical protein